MSEGMVYVVQGGEYFKIGRTKNLEKRLRVIQTTHAWALKVIQIWNTPDSILVERYLHRRFSEVRMHGEWFALSSDDLQMLQGIEFWNPSDLHKPKVSKLKKEREYPLGELFTSPMHEVLAEYGITRPIDLSKRGKLSRAYAHLIWTGKRHISRKMARHIESHTGIPYDQLMAAIPPLPKRPPDPKAPPGP